MGRIKSALEIALERTETVKSDRASLDQFDTRQQGKRLANQFLEEQKPAVLEEEIRKTPRERQAALKQGIFDVLISRLGLPLSRDDEKRIAAAGKGLQIIINNPRFNTINKQLGQILSQYLDQVAQYEEAIKRQYSPKLRQKEEELSRRLGRQIQIDPFQDPEFTAFYNQNMNALKGNYQPAVDGVREEAIRLFEKN
ncbi:MAG: hypothetical protein LBD78_00310 [Spirochaetaceae bacterium]|jgi:hypothetical protein|nr:hypothetical protein [Spirochaetaceae bacterium]